MRKETRRILTGPLAIRVTWEYHPRMVTQQTFTATWETNTQRILRGKQRCSARYKPSVKATSVIQACPSDSDYIKRAQRATKAIALCLAKDMLPIYTVEKPGFKSMIHQFNPRYQLPGRMHFNWVALPALASDVTACFKPVFLLWHNRSLDFWSWRLIPVFYMPFH